MTIALDIIIVVALAVTAVIDARKLIIPDSLSLLIAIAAATNAYLAGPDMMLDAALGAVMAFALFESTRRVMSWRMKREAMGFGDVKLMTAGGIWIGATTLPSAILAACVFALIGMAIRYVMAGHATRDMPMPFGPFLALGLILAKFWPFAGLV